MPAILSGLDAAAVPWRTPDGYLALPIAGIIAAGIRR
jgi:hypothetical protein